MVATVSFMDMSASVTLPAGWEHEVREAVAAVRPDLRAGSLRLLGAGLESVALLLRSEDTGLVLRLPQTSDGADGIEVEAQLLPWLADQLPVAVPRFLFTARNPLGPGRFCAYPLVPGESLSADQWRTRGLLTAPAPAHQVADIIDAIHAFPVDQARVCGVPEWDLCQDFADDLVRIRAEVVPLLPSDAARTLLAAWDHYLDDGANFDYVPTLTHSDVALDHLLVADSEISGLIDFGDVAISDPDYDLCFLWSQAGRAFVQRIQEHRGEPMSTRLVSKLRFWALADPANDVLHGIDNGMPDFRDRSVRLLHDRLSAYGTGAAATSS